MVTLEQVLRRVFSDSSWLIKTVIGAFLVFVPPLALGYLYRVALMGRRGHPLELPDWDDWRGLFIDGLRLSVIVLVLAVAPIFVGWLLSLPFQIPLFAGFFNPLRYLLVLPGLLLAVPLTAAGLYRYQHNHDFRQAFQFVLLFRMIGACGAQMIVPTLAYLGFALVLGPLILLVPYALFAGGVVVFYFFALTFHQIEAGPRSTASGKPEFRR
jgi:hypothetical protein